tara:strand:+ start:700 stop:1041 length:342 start_codon:yes stop_codon:yes gene_type:complete
MAIQPATYNMTIQRRSDHKIQIIFKDSTNTAINLTGYTVEAQVWEETRSIKYADWTIAYTDRSAGTVDMSLTDTQTATFLPDNLKYDVLLTNPTGEKEYYLEGNIKMSEGYTA